MNIFLPLQLALSALLRHKVRFVLTVLAISIGISAVIMVYAAGYGLEGMVADQLDTFGSGIIELEVKVPNTGKTSNENATAIAQGLTITTFKNKDVEAIEKHPNISMAYGVIMGQELVSYRDETKRIHLTGCGSELYEVEELEVLMGRYFTEDEDDSLSQVTVLGYEVWKDVFNGDDPIGKSIKIKGKKFRVIGVLEERGSVFFMNMDEQVHVPLQTMQKKILGVDYITYSIGKLVDASKEKAKRTQEDLILIMREQHEITDPNKDDFSVNTMDEAADMMGDVIDSITVLLTALVGISLLVGGVGIMNIMYVSVAERTFEIGLRKSLGAKKKDILLQFLFEALIITVGGGVVGVIIGAILSYIVKIVAVSYGFVWVYYVSPKSIIIAVGFSLVVGLIFGIYPAKKAAALNPIEALRKE